MECERRLHVGLVFRPLGAIARAKLFWWVFGVLFCGLPQMSLALGEELQLVILRSVFFFQLAFPVCSAWHTAELGCAKGAPA